MPSFLGLGRRWTGLKPVDRSHVASVARATPAAMLGYCLNTAIATLALIGVTSPAFLITWGIYSLSVALLVLTRSLRYRQKPRLNSRRKSRNASRRALTFALVLASPWSILGVVMIGSTNQREELIIVSLGVGMAASGSVLLSPISSAAIAYMLAVLIPPGLKYMLWLGDKGDLILGGLTFSYIMFLLALIETTHRWFAEKERAVNDLERSLEKIQSARQQIEHVAMHDSLTGLANRRAFLAALSGLNTTENKNYALFYLDLDRFKFVNDTSGHHVGDLLLQTVAKRLKSCVVSNDIVARLGGDEFAIVAKGVESREHAGCIAARLIEAISQPYILPGDRVLIGATIGIALPTSGLGADEELLRMADLAMYAAKARGRNTYEVFEPALQIRANAKRSIETGLREALAQSRLELWYQPIVELDTGDLVGLEALLRWRHPERGTIAPSEFLTVCEETGLITDIGAWVLAEACRHAAMWPGSPFVSVNLSPLQLQDRRIIDVLRSTLHESGLPSHRLQIEITETALLQDNTATKELLNEIRELGIVIALDDFGTGYSSLSYLASFPFDKIKIDRSFVQRLSALHRTDPIITAIIQLAEGLGCSVIAEGIETADQAEILRITGARFGQGYLFSKPVTMDRLAEIVAAPKANRLQADASVAA